MAKGQFTHGCSYHPLYPVWTAMRNRCYNPKNRQFDNYGGRGITICDEWREDPGAFIAWAEGPGKWVPGLQVDREDNDKGYSPDNCRCVDTFTQQNNRRKAVFTDLGRAFHSLAVRQSGRLRKGIVYRQHSDETCLEAHRLRSERNTQHKISQILGVPEGGVPGLLHRAEKLLKERSNV